MKTTVSRRSFMGLMGAAALSIAAPMTAFASDEEEPTKRERVSITPSPDKYTWYIKDYVGLNAASIGYTSLGGNRMEKYGAGLLKVIFVTTDGTYVDIADEEALKGYKVFAQNLEPNTEIKLAFETDSKGEEYNNLVSFQSQEEIVLAVCKVDEEPGEAVCMTPIEPSPDKYTCYVRDYVGRNLRSCGYTSLGSDRMDAYGGGYIELVLFPDDGSFIDPTDEESLSEYVVTGQSYEPNTQITFTFLTDSNGVEYDNLVDTKSIESIDLYVSRVQ